MGPKLAVVGVAGVALLLARDALRNLGATKRECRTGFPGDDLVPDPAVVTTRAVTIEAPAAQVWRWLVQIGQNRGGFYSYETLENLIGLDIHNADRVHPEWQTLLEGDKVWLAPPGRPGMREGLALTVRQVVDEQLLVLFGESADAVWSFHIHSWGPRRCRLISRSRTSRAHGFTGLAVELFDPVTLIMTRKMLREIKRRAENESLLPVESPTAHDLSMSKGH
jgi:hypothetical protein